jgi:hypothetical protein
MTFLEQSFGCDYGDVESETAIGVAVSEPEVAVAWQCDRVCPNCAGTTYCTFETGHGGSHGCSDGHYW